MTSRRTWLFLLALSIASLGAADPTTGGTGTSERRPPEPPSGCKKALSADNAEQIFDALRKATTGDGCTLEGVQTERERMKVTWKKNGTLTEPVLIQPTECATKPTLTGKLLSITVPPAARSTCPEAVTVIEGLIQTKTFGGLVELTEGKGEANDPRSPPAKERRRLTVRLVIFGVILAGIAAIVVLRRRRARAAAAAGAGAGAAAPKPEVAPKAEEPSGTDSDASPPPADGAAPGG